jgi:TFIIF-interacting CTD phosphatase-like protein
VKILVLDLDETLVYSTLERPPVVDHELLIAEQTCFVRVRPGVQSFVERMRSCFGECRIWSTGQPIYVESVCKTLGIDWMTIWGRDRCRRLAVPVPGADPYDKPLELISNDPRSIVIVDNAPSVFACNPQNGIPITTWRGDPSDRQLDLIGDYLEVLSLREDMRGEHGQWAAQVLIRRNASSKNVRVSKRQ